MYITNLYLGYLANYTMKSMGKITSLIWKGLPAFINSFFIDLLFHVIYFGIIFFFLLFCLAPFLLSNLYQPS